MAEFAIESQHLRKEYGETVAVADLSLAVPRGEVFGFLGPNGAGKTTSIKMLLGLVRPTSGAARMLGKPLGDRHSRRRIGFLPEHFRFYDWVQAGEFLHLHGRLYGMNRQQRQAIIPDLLNLVGLEGQMKSRLHSFSKGMLQRIGLAQALMNKPELVILDEPTSGLDPFGRRLVRDIIKRLRDEGTAVFINSHLLSEIEQTCDRVAFIKQGRVIEVNVMSELNQGKVALTMRVGQPDEALLAHLKRVATNVELEEGVIRLQVANEGQIPSLAEWLIVHKYNLYELNPYRMSLEERFLEVLEE